MCHSYAALDAVVLGYPDQGLTRSQEAVTLAQQIAHPFSLGFALAAAMFHQFRREVRVHPGTCRSRHQPCQGTGISVLAGVWCYPAWLGAGAARTGAGRDRADRAGPDSLACHRSRVSTIVFSGAPRRSIWDQEEPEAGLTVLTEALTLVDTTGERWYEARTVSAQRRTPVTTVFGQSG